MLLNDLVSEEPSAIGIGFKQELVWYKGKVRCGTSASCYQFNPFKSCPTTHILLLFFTSGAREAENAEDGNEASSPTLVDLDDPKLGTKKRAKLEAKAEKKAQKEVGEMQSFWFMLRISSMTSISYSLQAETKLREQRKIQQEKEDAERKLREEKEKAAEEKQEEEKRRAEEERKRKEEENYQKMKSAFVVEEEGFDEEGADEEGNLLQEFIDHIKVEALFTSISIWQCWSFLQLLL